MPAYPSKLRTGKVIKDQIHDLIDLEPLDLAVIDTRSFQRLREVKQLGTCYYVYPGATHNRFEHSIGTAHLAGLFMDNLRKEQPDLEISDTERNCVRLAALCHDLGHGPFSHVFDNEFMRKAAPEKKWTHEQQSGVMLDYIVNEEWNGVFQDLDTHEVKTIKEFISHKDFVKDLIKGKPGLGSKHFVERKFLFQIVANKTSSIDVDKFDYLKRDSHNVLGKSVFDHSRFMKFSRVIDNEICYKAPADQSNIYELFQARYNLSRTIYTHKVTKAVELMVVDALLAAEDFLQISSKVDNPESFLELTDTILHNIEFSKNVELEESRGVIRRIRRRDLYMCVDCVVIPDNNDTLVDLCRPGALSEDDIAMYSGGSIRPDDIILDFVRLNFGNGKKNPAELVRFYNKYDLTESFYLPPQACTALVPTTFEELQLRVFVKHESKQRAAQKAFRSWALAQHIPKENHNQEFATFSPEPVNSVLSNSRYSSSGAILSQEGVQETMSCRNRDDDDRYDLHNDTKALSTPTPSKRFHMDCRAAMDPDDDDLDDGIDDGSLRLKEDSGWRNVLSTSLSQTFASPLSIERSMPLAPPSTTVRSPSASTVSSQLFASDSTQLSSNKNQTLSQFPATLQRVHQPSPSTSQHYLYSDNNANLPISSASRYQQRIAVAAAVSACGMSTPLPHMHASHQALPPSPRTPSQHLAIVGIGDLLTPS
ncbi:hypothetical protein SeMB42_g06723 [Synchytrium endobioticum]|uniref:HD domain-containing protein n=1 Tax=Synchytrium endobioticum TaxID=286115 RepID=A0A507CJK1_9FUNG|nr:hypothetical protein SeMB42_g06723 [Synchytrium endobioticum]